MEREVGVKFRVSKILVQPPAGIEPAIFCLRSKRFTTKLKRKEVVRVLGLDIFNKEFNQKIDFFYTRNMFFSFFFLFERPRKRY